MIRTMLLVALLALAAVPAAAAEPEGSATEGDCANVYIGGTPPVEIYPSNCHLPGSGEASP